MAKVYGIESQILRAETLNPVLKMLEMFPTEVFTNSAAAIYEIIKISDYWANQYIQPYLTVLLVTFI